MMIINEFKWCHVFNIDRSLVQGVTRRNYCSVTKQIPL